MLRKSVVLLLALMTLAVSGCVLDRVMVRGGGCAVNLETQQTGEGDQFWDLNLEKDGINVNLGGEVK